MILQVILDGFKVYKLQDCAQGIQYYKENGQKYIVKKEYFIRNEFSLRLNYLVLLKRQSTLATQDGFNLPVYFISGPVVP